MAVPMRWSIRWRAADMHGASRPPSRGSPAFADRARHRLLARPEMLFYSAAVGLYLAYVGLAGSSAGILLWPAIALHLYQRPYALTAAHCREVIEETMSGWSAKRFHAVQQASTMAG